MLSAEVIELAQPWLDVAANETRNRKCEISYGPLEKQQNCLHIAIKDHLALQNWERRFQAYSQTIYPFTQNIWIWISQPELRTTKISIFKQKIQCKKFNLLVVYPWINYETLSDSDKGKLQILLIFFSFFFRFNLNLPDDLVFIDYRFSAISSAENMLKQVSKGTWKIRLLELAAD